MNLTPELILQLIAGIGGAATVYAAIRADLAMLHERTKTTKETADKAHQRIDEIQGFINERRRNHGD